MDFRHISVTPLTPTIGALVEGVALNAIPSEDVFEEIRQALWRHHVIFFRNQPMAEEDMYRLGSRFGGLAVHEFMKKSEAFPEVHVTDYGGAGPAPNARWHTDVTFRPEPSLVHILRPLELPPAGGDTLWCSTAAAFDALPDPIKTMLLGLEAEHDLAYEMRKFWSGHRETDIEREIRDIRENPAVVHPAVITHPMTGRLTLFVNTTWTKKFVGIDMELSNALMAMLCEWVKKPEFQVRFRWEPGSVGIWDNFATQHYAATDYRPHYRAMQRVTAGSAVPTLDMSKVPAHLRPPQATAQPAAAE